MWRGYHECLKDLSNRSDKATVLVDYLRRNIEDLGLPPSHVLLSIRPGDGSVDKGFIKQLPLLRQYIALEPDLDVLEVLEKKLSDIDYIQKKYVGCSLEEYKGPAEPVDVLLLCLDLHHSIHYLEELLRRAYTWVSPGGKIILTVGHNSILQILRNVSAYSWPKDGPAHAQLVRDTLDRSVFKYKESSLDFDLDISDPGFTYYGFISVYMNRKLTQDETDRCLMEVKRSACLTETGRVKLQQSVFLIPKQ